MAPGVPYQSSFSYQQVNWVVDGANLMAKCPGIGRFLERKCREKRREREGENYIPRVTWKTNSSPSIGPALTHEGTGAPPGGDLESPMGGGRPAGFHSKELLWRMRKADTNLQVGFSTKKM